MIVYKILHKPTGLFYTPSKGYGNLSVSGKIYPKKLSLKHISTTRIVINCLDFRDKTRQKLSKKSRILIDYFNIKIYNGFQRIWYYYDENHHVPKSDWEIIEF